MLFAGGAEESGAEGTGGALFAAVACAGGMCASALPAMGSDLTAVNLTAGAFGTPAPDMASAFTGADCRDCIAWTAGCGRANGLPFPPTVACCCWSLLSDLREPMPLVWTASLTALSKLALERYGQVSECSKSLPMRFSELYWNV